MAFDVIVPVRRVGVLKIRHEHRRSRVQSIDDHFAFHRPGDLYSTVLQGSRNRRYSPAAGSYAGRLGQKIRHLPSINRSLPLNAPLQQLFTLITKAALECRYKAQGIWSKNLSVS